MDEQYNDNEMYIVNDEIVGKKYNSNNKNKTTTTCINETYSTTIISIISMTEVNITVSY